MLNYLPASCFAYRSYQMQGQCRSCWFLVLQNKQYDQMVFLGPCRSSTDSSTFPKCYVATACGYVLPGKLDRLWFDKIFKNIQVGFQKLMRGHEPWAENQKVKVLWGLFCKSCKTGVTSIMPHQTRHCASHMSPCFVQNQNGFVWCVTESSNNS